MGGIFICYRRDDNRHAAGRLHDSLRRRFSSDQIFLDVDNIDLGSSFREVIRDRIAASDAILVVIGPDWLDSRDPDGQRRLDDPEDLVRLEIEAGLQRGILVIPVLIDGAAMPQAVDLPISLRPLASKNGITISHASFQRDSEHLNGALLRVLRPKNARTRAKPSTTRGRTGTKRKDVGDDGANEWNAEFHTLHPKYFSIRFWRPKESHRLELRSTSSLVDKVYLDGNVLYQYWMTGRKEVDFQVGSHPDRFQLKFHVTALGRLKEIELWVDNRPLLSSPTS